MTIKINVGSVKKTAEFVDLLKAFGCSDGTIAEAYNHTLGYSVESTNMYVHMGVVKQKVPVNAGAILMAEKGILGKSSKALLAQALETSVTKIVKSIDSGGALSEATKKAADKAKAKSGIEISKIPVSDIWAKPDPSDPHPDTPSTVKPVAEHHIKPKAAKAAKVVKEDKDVKAAMSKAKVKLFQADTMYQPVYGTSSGSTYYVVALGKVNVAVRFQDQNLSIRVEGEISPYEDLIKMAGIKCNDGYASVHLKSDDRFLLWKAVGAALAVLAPLLETPMPNLHHIEG